MVVTALDVESTAVRQQLRNVHMHVHAGTVFEVGELVDSGRRIVLLLTGQGNQPAAVLTERAINEFSPVAVLVVGIAGALAEEIAVGDVVVGTKVYAVHGGKEDDTGHKARPEVWLASHDLEQVAHVVARAPTSADDPAPRPKVHFRPIASGEVELNSRRSPLARQIEWHYNDAAAIEMASAGVAAAAHRNRQLPVLTVRGMSDKADGAKRPADDTDWQSTAAGSAAAFAAAIVRRWEPAAGEVEQPTDDRMAPVLASLVDDLRNRRKRDRERRLMTNPDPLALRWQTPAGQSGRFDQLGALFASLRPHRLVILGRSGSGKTTSVSHLVLDLLARRSPRDPVPVLFSLGGWDSTRQRLPDWIVDQLHRDYSGLRRRIVSETGDKQTVAAVLVGTSRILPVLDGLDEIAEPMRGKAIDAINRLGSDVPLVLTSRTDEYWAAVSEAERELSHTVIAELQSLDLADVRRYLSDGTGQRWNSVTTCLSTHPDGQLARVLSTPLMVWLARVTYGAPSACADELCGEFESETALENHLLGNLVPAVYPDHPTPHGPGAPPGTWNADEAQHGLEFLARHLIAQQQTDLAWWKLHRSVRCVDQACRAVGGTLWVGGMSLAVGAPPTIVTGAMAVLGGLAMASGRCLTFIGVNDIETPRAFQLKWRTVRGQLLEGLVILVMTMITLLSGILTVAVALAFPLTSFRAIVVFAVTALITLTCVTWWAVRWSKRWKRRKQPPSPGPVIQIDIRRAVSVRSTLRADRAVALSAFIVFPVAFIIVPLMRTVPFWTFLGHSAPFMITMCTGWVITSAYIKFRVTCIVLALRGRLPWRTVRFFEDAHYRGVLRQAGSVYQFRHGRLRDRLGA